MSVMDCPACGHENRATAKFCVECGASGEVIVGTIGRDLRMDYMAQGHTVGLAQRIRKQRES